MSLNELDIDEWDSLMLKSCGNLKLSETSSGTHSHGPLDVFRSCTSGPSVKCPPILKQNFSCVVAGVSLRHQGDGLEVLLIQEAKLSCRGKWYLPAGRVELGETLKEALVREIKEEAGVDCHHGRLIAVEQNELTYFRITSLFEVAGGNLKTKESADSESIQARWFPVDEVLQRSINLRDTDILHLINRATQIFLNSPNSTYVPAIRETPCLFHVWNFLVANTQLSRIIVRSDETGDRLPQLCISWTSKPEKFPERAAAKLILKGNHDLSIVGAINVCCNFHPAGMHDGIGVSLLFIHSSPESELNYGFHWRPVTKALETQLNLTKESLADFSLHWR